MSSSSSSGLDSLIELLSSEEGVKLQSERLDGLKRLAEFELQSISLEISPEKLRDEIKQRKKAGLAADAPFSFDRKNIPVVLDLHDTKPRRKSRTWDANDRNDLLTPTRRFRISSMNSPALNDVKRVEAIEALDEKGSFDSNPEALKSTVSEAAAQDLIRKLENDIKGLGLNLSKSSFISESNQRNATVDGSNGVGDAPISPSKVIGDPWAAIRKKQPNDHQRKQHNPQPPHPAFAPIPSDTSSSFGGPYATSHGIPPGGPQYYSGSSTAPSMPAGAAGGGYSPQQPYPHVNYPGMQPQYPGMQPQYPGMFPPVPGAMPYAPSYNPYAPPHQPGVGYPSYYQSGMPPFIQPGMQQPHYYPASAPVPVPAAVPEFGYSSGSNFLDPQQQAMLSQMQKVAEQMERENEKFMRQLEQSAISNIGLGGLGGLGGIGGGLVGGLGAAGVDPLASITSGLGAPGLKGLVPVGQTRGSGLETDLATLPNVSNNMSKDDSKTGGISAAAAPTSRLGKLEQKHQEDIRIIQHEIEKLKQQQELEEFKTNLDKLRQAKAQDDAHEIWLAEQKQQLQALKIKQAIAKEQKLLSIQLEQSEGTVNGGDPASGTNVSNGNMQTTTAAAAAAAGDRGGGDKIVRLESGVGTADLPLSLIKGVVALADGLLVPRDSKIFKMGDSFRLAVGIYDRMGNTLTKLMASDWQPWTGMMMAKAGAAAAAVGKKEDVNSSWTVEYLLSSVKRSTKQNGANNNALPSGVGSQLEGSRCLVEVQVRSDSNGGGIQKSAGWGTVALDCVHGSATSGTSEKILNNGLWRVAIRTGAPNPASDPLSPPSSLTGDDGDDDVDIKGWLLLRVADVSDAPVAASWSAMKSLPTAAKAMGAYSDPLSKPQLPAAGNRRSSVGSNVPKLPSLSKAGSLDSLTARSTARSMLTGRTSRTINTSRSARDFGSYSQDSADGKPVTVLDTLLEHEEEAESNSATSTSQWLLGAQLGPCTDLYQRGDGIDIYIDAANFLPDNCTIARVVLKLLSADREQVGGLFECHAAGDSNATAPSFKFKAECRAKSFNPTTTALLRIDTLDSSTLLPSCVGYAAFKLFATRNRAQPRDANEANVFINSGKFQFPLYAGRPPPADVYNENMLNSMPKIPCASVLVRIYEAPKSADGLSTLSREEFPREEWLKMRLDIPAPLYSSGAYCGALCEPIPPYEPIAYGAKETSPVATQSIDVAITQAIAMHKSQGGSRMATILPPKPTGTLVALEQRQWLEKLLPPSTEMRNIIDYSFALPYTLDAGLSVCIHQLFNTPDFSGSMFKSSESIVYKVITSVVPPGLYYKEPPLTESVRFTKNNDFDSPAMAQSFSDGFFDFCPPELHECVYLLVDVRAVQVEVPKGGETEPLVIIDTRTSAAVTSAAKTEKGNEKKAYWTMLPLSRELVPGQGYKYVNMGVFQLPLIEGRVPPVGDLFSTPNPWRTVLSRLEYNDAKNPIPGLKLSADGASVIVQVANPLLKDMCGVGKGLLKGGVGGSAIATGGAGAGAAAGRRSSVVTGMAAGSGAAAARRSSVSTSNSDGVVLTANGKMYTGLRTFYMERMIRAAAAGLTGARVATIEKFAFDPARYNKANAKGGAAKSLAQSLPKGFSLAEADLRALQKKINKSFSAATGIQEDA